MSTPLSLKVLPCKIFILDSGLRPETYKLGDGWREGSTEDEVCGPRLTTGGRTSWGHEDEESGVKVKDSGGTLRGRGGEKGVLRGKVGGRIKEVS